MAHTPTCDFVLDTIPCTGRPIILYVVHSGRSRIFFRVAGARGGLTIGQHPQPWSDYEED